MLEKMKYLLIAVACSMALSCGRLSPAVPTEVEIDWPDAGLPAAEPAPGRPTSVRGTGSEAPGEGNPGRGDGVNF